jgi:hypothetical protein
MPAKSKAAKRGEKKVSELKGAAKSMYDSMSKKELHEFADTETKDKPRHIGGKH